MLIGRASSLTICYWVGDQSPRGEAYSDRFPEVGRTDWERLFIATTQQRTHRTHRYGLNMCDDAHCSPAVFFSLLTHFSSFHFSSSRAFPPLLERARAEARRWCSVSTNPASAS
jgi:hypothetical protein